MEGKCGGRGTKEEDEEGGRNEGSRGRKIEIEMEDRRGRWRVKGRNDKNRKVEE